MEEKIYYFEQAKHENSDIVLGLVKKKAQEKGIKHVVVASTRGESGVRAAEALKGCGINVVVVTHSVGPQGPELLPENERKIRELGAKVVTGTHAFVGVGGSLRRSPPRVPNQPMPTPYWPAYVPSTGDLIAMVLRLFSQGMKVCFEIVTMAADAGAIPHGENVIAIGGQGRGSDTAIVIRSAGTGNFFDLDVQEIIAKPAKKSIPTP